MTSEQISIWMLRGGCQGLHLTRNRHAAQRSTIIFRLTPFSGNAAIWIV